MTVMQLKWNSQILNDFRQTFSFMSKIFKKPSEPIVSKEFGLLGMWIAWTIWLNFMEKVLFMGFWNDIIFYVLLLAHA